MEDKRASNDLNKERNAIRLFDKHARQYETLFMDVSSYNSSLEFVCQLLKAEQTQVLDLGCGPGNLSKYFLNLFPRLQLIGIDGSEKMIELAQKNNPGASFLVQDLLDPNFSDQAFDLVILGFCLPYLSSSEVKAMFQTLSTHLKPSALLYLSTMEALSEKSGKVTNSHGEQTIQFYYSFSDLAELLTDFGFEIEHVSRVPIPKPGPFSKEDICIVARKSS